MMAGKFREYNWNDIVRLIYEDAGLKSDEQQRSHGTMVCTGFVPPQHAADTIIRVQVYDKPYEERINEHVSGPAATKKGR